MQCASLFSVLCYLNPVSTTQNNYCGCGMSDIHNSILVLCFCSCTSEQSCLNHRQCSDSAEVVFIIKCNLFLLDSLNCMGCVV